ncbi:MAG: group 1 glycosyl transferase [Rhodobacteraceae bacterium]|uniref:glycosyltransferase family 4 protein n=1 Tax=Cypionkella sp. TaxID=2811411 RepID=UPI001320E981|nr:glycosyltransferase family 4 protein [Cypionkella sp.]KAF0174796.1 MAG: group 1 glycosyl transferase [Paracoccaceae bacterium]MDO8328017.1 glycosyltransferase family 4 protein [Cypionkella sp.]
MTDAVKAKTALVVQFGGRRQYAVPHAIANRYRLAQFYTDICAGAGAGRMAPAVAMLTGKRLHMDLTNRRPPENVRCKTTTFASWMIEMRAALRVGDPLARLRKVRAAHDAAARRMCRLGFHGATHLLSQFGEAIPLQCAARDAGLLVATDINIAPSTEEIVRREQASFPDWEPPTLYYGQILAEGPDWQRPMTRMEAASDLFFCPSVFVQQDLIQNFGIAAARTRLVPYAVNPKWFAVENRPEPGRVLFAGGVGLRKGIHVLAEAARILRDRKTLCEIVVAGGVDDHLRNRPECGALTFLGKLAGPQMMAEFARADVFTLPSLAEGSAGVTYEAMGCGIPVITTVESGSVVRDGIDGCIVPARNAEALAEAIERIIRDRDLRDRMAYAARLAAMDFIWSRYQDRLHGALFGAGAQVVG